MNRSMLCGLALAMCANVTSPTFGDSTPPFDDVVLVVAGGPISADVEVSINGEWAATISDDPALFIEIADLLRPGENRMEVKLARPSQARQGSQRLLIAIQRTESSARRRSTTGPPMAEIVVPGDIDPDATCEEKARFWMGEPPLETGELKYDYWLFMTGPPVGVRVTVSVNETVVYETASGNHFIDVTPYTMKGKNTAKFESRPTCLVEKSGREGWLQFSIGEAELEVDTVKATAPPAVFVEFRQKRKPVPETIEKKFRAR